LDNFGWSRKSEISQLPASGQTGSFMRLEVYFATGPTQEIEKLNWASFSKQAHMQNTFMR
jgi:hypothetical protein